MSIEIAYSQLSNQYKQLQEELLKTVEELNRIHEMKTALHISSDQRIAELESALRKIVNQPLEPAHIYEIADRIKLIAKVALEI